MTVAVYLLMALVVYLLYNSLHYEQTTLLDCEIHKGRASIKTLSVASYTKPVLLSLAKNSLETGLLSDMASCGAQLSLSIFGLHFLCLCGRFILRFNSSGE